MDRISNLPDIAIETTLKCLSLRDAVRTSALAHGWREKWCTVPQLIFDPEGLLPSGHEPVKKYDRRNSRIVDQVLLLHRGPIHKFKLSIGITSCHDIDRWIHYLSRHGVEEFILDMPLDCEHYRLPFCFFSFKELTNLELCQCIFDPPSSFSGYSRLTVLDLFDVRFTDDGFKLLLSVCPLLKKLVLRHVWGCSSFRINSPKLVELSIEGGYIPLYIECAPLLAMLSITYLTSLGDLSAEDKMIHDIADIFGNLPSIERLTMRDHTIESFSCFAVPVKLPVLLPLRYLSIDIDFLDEEELLPAFCIFRSLPMLEKLDIKAIGCGIDFGVVSDDFWQEHEHFNCTFSRLQIVKLTEFSGTTTQLKVIELIIANAPILEKLQIEFRKRVDALKILHEIVRFPRSSAKAEIIAPAAGAAF